MQVSAKSEYAVRAMLELAAADGFRSADDLAAAQDIPPSFLKVILNDLRRSRLVRSRRGAAAGYALARPAGEISVADVIRSVDGQLANVRGLRPEELAYHGPATSLLEVWIAARHALRSVLDNATLADVAGGELSAKVLDAAAQPDAWE